MDQTLKSLVRFLEEGTPELRIATAQVLGELASPAPAVSRALAARLTADESYLTPFVLDALAGIGTKEAVRELVSRLHVAGSVGDRVAHLLSQMGSQVTKALAPIFDDGDAEMQTRVLEILGRHRDREALGILRKALLRPDSALSGRAASVLLGHIDELDTKQADLLLAGLERSLAAKSAATLAPESVANALGVLGRVGGARCRATLLKFATAKQDPIVRQSALQALVGVPLTPGQCATVLGYVEEDDMTHVVRPAIRLLDGLTKWTPAAQKNLQAMLESRSEERSLFALRALRDMHSESLAKTCQKMLLSRGPAFQAAATEHLAGNAKAVPGLLKAFQTEKNVDRARLLAVPLGRLGEHLEDAHIKGLVEKASKLITAGDPLGDVHLQLLFDAAPETGPSTLVDKAVRLRRARRLPECLAVLMRMAHADMLGDEGRYQLAVVRLMLDGKEGPGKGVDRKDVGDATMGYFAPLVRGGFPLFDRLKREGQLTPEDLLRVGRHFVEGVAQERRFGAELLSFVADKHGRQRVGEEAKLMLRAGGF